MAIIDEKGRVFGRVNVVDAAVVLLVLVLIVAGVGLVFGDDGDTEPEDVEPRNLATVAFTTPLDSDAALLDAGDVVRPVRGGDELDVVDVYRSFTPNGTAYVVARVEHDGDLETDSRLYAGDEGSYVVEGHRVTASVLGINESGERLSTTNASIVISSNADPAVAAALDPGDEATIGDDVVATVRGVAGREGDGFLVGLDVRALDRGAVDTFDGESLRIGNRLSIVTDDAVVRGRVVATETSDPADVDVPE